MVNFLLKEGANVNAKTKVNNFALLSCALNVNLFIKCY